MQGFFSGLWSSFFGENTHYGLTVSFHSFWVPMWQGAYFLLPRSSADLTMSVTTATEMYMYSLASFPGLLPNEGKGVMVSIMLVFLLLAAHWQTN